MRRTQISTLFLGMVMLAAVGCSGKKGHESSESKQEVADPTGPRFQVDTKFQQQLSATFNEYLRVKDALVASDGEEARAASTQARTVLNTVDGSLLSGAARSDWNAYRGEMDRTFDRIAMEADLDEQRALFSDLTAAMYESVKAFGLGGDIAYYEYCPMAFDNEGGYWLSDSETIRNPYFGDEMLTCGTVREKLQ